MSSRSIYTLLDRSSISTNTFNSSFVMNIRLFSVIMAGLLSVSVFSDRSIAKPTSDDNTIGNGIKFTFQGCTYENLVIRGLNDLFRIPNK
jgi:hypothetical protein